MPRYSFVIPSTLPPHEQLIFSHVIADPLDGERWSNGVDPAYIRSGCNIRIIRCYMFEDALRSEVGRLWLNIFTNNVQPNRDPYDNRFTNEFINVPIGHNENGDVIYQTIQRHYVYFTIITYQNVMYNVNGEVIGPIEILFRLLYEINNISTIYVLFSDAVHINNIVIECSGFYASTLGVPEVNDAESNDIDANLISEITQWMVLTSDIPSDDARSRAFNILENGELDEFIINHFNNVGRNDTIDILGRCREVLNSIDWAHYLGEDEVEEVPTEIDTEIDSDPESEL